MKILLEKIPSILFLILFGVFIIGYGIASGCEGHGQKPPISMEAYEKCVNEAMECEEEGVEGCDKAYAYCIGEAEEKAPEMHHKGCPHHGNKVPQQRG